MTDTDDDKPRRAKQRADLDSIFRPNRTDSTMADEKEELPTLDTIYSQNDIPNEQPTFTNTRSGGLHEDDDHDELVDDVAHKPRSNRRSVEERWADLDTHRLTKVLSSGSSTGLPSSSVNDSQGDLGSDEKLHRSSLGANDEDTEDLALNDEAKLSQSMHLSSTGPRGSRSREPAKSWSAIDFEKRFENEPLSTPPNDRGSSLFVSRRSSHSAFLMVR
jgi:hypothetical protein